MTGLLEAAAQQVTRWRAWSPSMRKEKNLVGLAAMVMVDGQVEAAAAHGERKKGSGVPLEIGDRWHLGGITKSHHGHDDRALGRIGSDAVVRHRRRDFS